MGLQCAVPYTEDDRLERGLIWVCRFPRASVGGVGGVCGRSRKIQNQKETEPFPTLKLSILTESSGVIALGSNDVQCNSATVISSQGAGALGGS